MTPTFNEVKGNGYFILGGLAPYWKRSLMASGQIFGFTRHIFKIYVILRLQAALQRAGSRSLCLEL